MVSDERAMWVIDYLQNGIVIFISQDCVSICVMLIYLYFIGLRCTSSYAVTGRGFAPKEMNG